MEDNNGAESLVNNHDNNESSANFDGNKVAAPPQVVEAIPRKPWVRMPYPGAMVMRQGIMPPPLHYPPHYMPYHHHHFSHPHPPATPPHQNFGGNGNEENRTLWVGDLQGWMDEEYLRHCFASSPEVASIKIIRNKQTRSPEGYGFVEFFSHIAAEKALESYSRFPMPETDQLFRLNWASFSMGDKRSNNGSDLSVFVGDLASDVTDSLLHETFASKYPSVKGAKVVFDAISGRSKGYGFVRFGDENERSQALVEMNGVYCSSRPMRIGAATPRKPSNNVPAYSPQGGQSNGAASPSWQFDADTVNTTIFIGGLDPSVTDDDLRLVFSEYGEISSVKIPVGKGCGFVQFARRNEAETALEKMNGTTIGKQTVRLSWGRNPVNRPLRGAEYGNPWTGAYYGGPFFDGYGYAYPHPHDPYMYPTSPYGASYPMYTIPQQQVQ